MSESMSKKIYASAVSGIIMLLAGLLTGGSLQSGDTATVQTKILDKLNTIDKTSSLTQRDVEHLKTELKNLSTRVERNTSNIIKMELAK